MESAGGTRFSEGKPGGWWYGPLYGLRLVSEVWTPGGRKYAPLDWKSGQSFSTLVDCAFRHFLEVQQYGIWSRDEDTGAYHVAAVVWNLLCLLTFMALGRHDLDDVTPWEGVTTSTKRDAEAYAEANDVSVLEALRTIKEDTNHGA